MFLIFLPRRPRARRRVWSLAFQLAIMLTGNYNFFNLLTMLLCLFLFDDRQLRRVLPRGLAARIKAQRAAPGRVRRRAGDARRPHRRAGGAEPRSARRSPGAVCPIAGWLTEALAPLLHRQPVRPLRHDDDDAAGDRHRGLRRRTDLARIRVPLQARPDRRARPTWNIPHQPRLDWQLWFAASQGAGQNRWIEGLLSGCSRAARTCSALFAQQPVPRAPPKYVRAQLYDYRFADAELAGRAQARCGCAGWRASIFRQVALPISQVARACRRRSRAAPGNERDHHSTQRMQLLETRSVSMIAVRSKA